MQENSDIAETLKDLAQRALKAACDRETYLATAESCTGGYIASLLTGVRGLSHGFDRGYVTYSEEAKTHVLDIPAGTIERAGAVSEEVARLMAHRALELSKAWASVAVTGFLGGTTRGEENGLVHICALSRDGAVRHRECHFGDVEREEGRQKVAQAALEMLVEVTGPAAGPATGSAG